MWAWHYGEKSDRSDASRMSSRSSRFTPPMVDFCWRTCKHWQLPRVLRQHVVPWGCRTYPGCLFSDSAPAYTAKTTQWLMAEFWFLADWPYTYLLDLNPPELLTAAFAGKSPGYASHKPYCPMSVHRHRIWPASGGIQLQNLPLIPPLLLSRG